MPRTNEIRVKANNSNPNFAPCSAKTVSVPQLLINDLLQISSDLKGEEAIEEVMHFIDAPQYTDNGLYALKAVVHFYSNVRYLTTKIKELEEQ